MGAYRPALAASILAVCGLTGLAWAQAPRSTNGALLYRNPSAYSPASPVIGQRGSNRYAGSIGDQIWLNNQLTMSNPPATPTSHGYAGYTAPPLGGRVGYAPLSFRASVGYPPTPSSVRDRAGGDGPRNIPDGRSFSAATSMGAPPKDALQLPPLAMSGQRAPADPADAFFDVQRSKGTGASGSGGTTGAAAGGWTASMAKGLSLPPLIATPRDRSGEDWTLAASNLAGAGRDWADADGGSVLRRGPVVPDLSDFFLRARAGEDSDLATVTKTVLMPNDPVARIGLAPVDADARSVNMTARFRTLWNAATMASNASRSGARPNGPEAGAAGQKDGASREK